MSLPINADVNRVILENHVIKPSVNKVAKMAASVWHPTNALVDPALQAKTAGSLSVIQFVRMVEHALNHIFVTAHQALKVHFVRN